MDYKETLHMPNTTFEMRGNLAKKEPGILKKWQENNYYQNILAHHEGEKSFILHDGPPYANGNLHAGTAMNRSIKDFIVRSHAMLGFYTPFFPGWDTHGLPTENAIQKLGVDRKKITAAEFRKKCDEFVHTQIAQQMETEQRLGQVADYEHPYITLLPEFEERQVKTFGKMASEGMIFQGLKPVYWSPFNETAVADSEIVYRDVKDATIYLAFQIADGKGILDSDDYYVIWTTTPWTLPSNVALCVNPDETYVKVKAADGYTYYMAEALLDKVLGGLAVKAGQTVKGESLDEDAKDANGAGIDYEVLETYKGKDLEYKEYEPLYQCAADCAAKQHKKGHFVTCDTYVTMSDGTGIVHIAPAFGEDDAKVGRKYDLPFVQFVDGKGDLTEETPYAGLFVKKADPEVLKDLDKEGKLFDAPKFEHDYPFCWRCDTPLIYYARESWFIKMTDPEVKANLIANNKTINWIPETIGTGRFGAWLENVQDWGISRNRYWGTPLNIWQCEDCGEMLSIGSIAELKEHSDNCPDDIELHRPYIDAVTCKCGKCGGTMKRVPEVIDCWFDSGSMPFAQHHYPFENKELFEQQFPAKFISEAVDQTRGWFYSLLAISTLLFNKAPYENVIVLGHVQDADGQKMSKSKGNAVDPFAALQKHGADAIRWYFYENSAPWLPNRFHDKAVTEGQRKFMGTIWNTYAFFVLYANIDDFDATKYTLEYDKLPVMDKWILSKLNTMVKTVDDNLNNYKITETARVLEDFVDELSNWYVRRCRERFWAKGMEQDKINAYMTLYTTLVTLCKAAAPMIPFMTESIYRNLVCSIDKTAPISVHLCDFPKVNEDWIDTKLEENMEDVLNAVVIGRACRNATNIKNRQPIGKMFIKAPWKLDDFFTNIIADELNVKSVEYKDDVRDFTSYTFKPQLKTLGPKYGKFLGEIRKQLSELDGNKAMDDLNNAGYITLSVNGQDVQLEKADLLIEMVQAEGYVANSDKGITVVMDTKLTPELIEEGFVRELVSKIQTMRKDAGFEVMDRINVYVSGNDKIAALMEKNAEQVKAVVLADNIIAGEAKGFTKDWNINGEDVTLGVEKQ